MNLLQSFLVVAGATGIAVTAMLMVRRRAPAGSYFADGDRAAGVFGVLASGFAILLGFIVFLAFTSYDSSRSGAEAEALIVAQQIETAQFFEPSAAAELTGELVCFARSVAGPEWEEMEDGTLDNRVNPWAAELFRTVRTVDPQTFPQEAAYSKWLDQTSAREEATQDRIHGAVGVIPSPLWIALFLISAVIFGYVLFFADSAEGPFVQGMLMGSVVAVMATLLLLLNFLDSPYTPGTGSLRPVAMERTLAVIDQQLSIADQQEVPPCDDRGQQR